MLCVEGLKDPGTPYWKWESWHRTNDRIPLPDVFAAIATKYEWLNIEYIGSKIIECHFRANPDFNIKGFENIQEIIPVWKDDPIVVREGYIAVADPDFSTLGMRKALLVKSLSEH